MKDSIQYFFILTLISSCFDLSTKKGFKPFVQTKSSGKISGKQAIVFTHNLNTIRSIASRSSYERISCMKAIDFKETLRPKSLSPNYLELGKEEQFKEVIYQYYAEFCADHMDEITHFDFKNLAKLAEISRRSLEKKFRKSKISKIKVGKTLCFNKKRRTSNCEYLPEASYKITESSEEIRLISELKTASLFKLKNDWFILNDFNLMKVEVN